MNLEIGSYTWFCLYSPPNREFILADELKKKAGLVTIIPAEKYWRDKKGHVRESFRPVMPRYVFTGWPHDRPPNWERIREGYAGGDPPWHLVQGYLEFGRGPTRLRHGDVVWLHILEEQLRGRQRPVEDVIKIGDTVKVISGPLDGYSVRVDKVVADKIHTLRMFLGAPRLFEIPVAQVAQIR